MVTTHAGGHATADGVGAEPLPAAILSGHAEGLVVLVDPVVRLRFAVHPSVLDDGVATMASPYGGLLDLAPARAAMRDAGSLGHVPTLATLVAATRAEGLGMLSVRRGSAGTTSVSRGPGVIGTPPGRPGHVAWFGMDNIGAALEAECFAKGVPGRPAAAHPLGVVVLRRGDAADVYLEPGDAEPLAVAPTLEGLLDAAAATGAAGFGLRLARGMERLRVDHPGDLVPTHRRMTWQGDADDARVVIRQVLAGSPAIARHRARVPYADEGWFHVDMPVTGEDRHGA